MEHEERSDELEEEADRLEKRSDELEEDIQDTGKDWESKKSDQSLAGAQPPQSEDEDSDAGDG